MSIEQIVQELISQDRESTFWDFKEKHHSTKISLLHDVLCLANCNHDGSRYLIFGVVDGTWEVVGVDDKKNQQFFLSFFHDQAKLFSGNIVPEFILHDIEIEKKNIQVLEIFDRPYKPYRLIETYSEGGNKIGPHLFTRIQDRNTPKDRSASQSELDRMYRERFGLELPPIDRMKQLLVDVTIKWESIDLGTHFCSDHPEYTYVYLDNDEETDLEWMRGEIGHLLPEGSMKCQVAFYYHQTKLAEVTYVRFDHGKKVCAAPDFEPFGGGRFYYFPQESLRYAFQRHIAAERNKDFTVGLRKSGGAGYFDIPVATKAEASEFCEKYSNKNTPVECNEAKQDEIFYDALLKFNDFCTKKTLQE